MEKKIKRQGKRKANKPIMADSKSAKQKKPQVSKDAEEKEGQDNKCVPTVEQSLKRKSDGTSDQDKKKPKLVKKEKKIERKIKSDKDIYELKKKLKLLFEKFRRNDCRKENKSELCKEVTALMKGHMKELIFAHDTVRVVEGLLKVSDRALWDELYLEVKDDIILLSKMKYAKFFVLKLLKYGSKEHKENVLDAFRGHIVQLTSHAEATQVVECIFNEHANGFQRKKMCMEFYGALFSICKNEEVKALKDILESDPSQKERILGQLKETITKLADKPSFCYSIVHRIVLEYLTYCSPKERTEIIETIRDSVIKILHTKDGAQIGMHCIWYGTAKDRKTIIKSFKTHLSKICQEENGSGILFAIFDHVDDTKLVVNVVVEEMLKTVATWAFTPVGRKVLLYFLAPRTPKYFHPNVQKLFQQGDDNVTSKKDKSVRHQEFMKAASPALLRFASDHAAALMKDPSSCFIMKEILLNCIGDKAEVFQDIAKLAFKPVDMPDMEDPHFIEQISVRAIFKSLFEFDKANYDAGNKQSLFCDSLLHCVPEESVQSWIHCNRGCFVLLMMLETKIPHIVAKVKALLKPVKKIVENKTFPGASLLLKAYTSS